MTLKPNQVVRNASSRRMCLYCGYRGRAIQRDGDAAVYACPKCRGDLYARPPRSYAEMEGLDQEPAVFMDQNVYAPLRRRPGLVGAAATMWRRVTRAFLWVLFGDPRTETGAFPAARRDVHEGGSIDVRTPRRASQPKDDASL